MNFKTLISKIDDCLEDNKGIAIICKQELALILTSYLDNYDMKSIYNVLMTKFTKSNDATYYILINCKDGSYEYFVDDFAHKFNLIVDEVYAIGEYGMSDLAHFHTNCITILKDMQITDEDIEFIQDCDEDDHCICDDKEYCNCECQCDECNADYECEECESECDCDFCVACNELDKKINEYTFVQKYDCKWGKSSDADDVEIDGCKFVMDESTKDKLAEKINFIDNMKKNLPDDIDEDQKDNMCEITWYYKEIMTKDICADCLLQILVEFAENVYKKGIDTGVKAHKDYMLECLCD